MRDPTFEEMVQGIRLAVGDRLELMRHGRYESKPEIAFPAAFRAAVREWLEDHTLTQPLATALSEILETEGEAVEEGAGDDIPIALVTLRGSEAEGWLWVVKCCPHCGETHVHGGGSGGGDPRRFLNHRVAHCGGEGGYDLVEDKEEEP